jgi:3-oxoacyl-[acyl-carrier protein] reductase
MILNGKVAIVTGASRGVGAGVARALAENGAIVCINYNKSKNKAGEVAENITQKGGNAFTHQADVTKFDEINRMAGRVVEKQGKIDILVNAALPDYKFDPQASYTSLETAEWNDFQKQINGTIQGAYNTVKAVLPSMKSNQFGKIINISTNLVYNPVVTYYDYTTAKAGLVGLTRNMAAELGAYGIRVNLVAGGLLQTTDASSATPEEVFNLIAQNTSLKKVVTVEEFANAVVFFASDYSNAVSGQSLAVDGGLTMP